MKKLSRHPGAVAAMACIALTACGSPDSAAPASPTISSTPDGTTPPQATASDQPPTTPALNAGAPNSGPYGTQGSQQSTPSITTTPTSPDQQQIEPENTASSIVLNDSEAGKPLTLSDFPFVTGNWKDGVYSVVGSTVTGIGTKLDGCYSDGSENELQLRLADKFTSLKLTIGQGNGGSSVHDSILAKIITNGNKVTTKSINPNNPNPLVIPVANVDAVELMFSLDQEVKDCGTHGDVEAVLYGIIAEK